MLKCVGEGTLASFFLALEETGDGTNINDNGGRGSIVWHQFDGGIISHHFDGGVIVILVIIGGKAGSTLRPP
jgi:hypothetical protein